MHVCVFAGMLSGAARVAVRGRRKRKVCEYELSARCALCTAWGGTVVGPGRG